MASDLHDRLTDLAGTRRPRRRRSTSGAVAYAGAGSAVAGRVALAVAARGAGRVSAAGPGTRPRPVQPADPNGSPHVPDRFFTPEPLAPRRSTARPDSSWRSGVPTGSRCCTPRRLVYGVTASTEHYGFLELPDTPSPMLDPSGWSPSRRTAGTLAYWVTGAHVGHAARAQSMPSAWTCAIYDTVTVAALSELRATAHGLRRVDSRLGRRRHAGLPAADSVGARESKSMAGRGDGSLPLGLWRLGSARHAWRSIDAGDSAGVDSSTGHARGRGPLLDRLGSSSTPRRPAVSRHRRGSTTWQRTLRRARPAPRW